MLLLNGEHMLLLNGVHLNFFSVQRIQGNKVCGKLRPQ